jgi:predicted PurR-regulated permease PerM
MLNISPFVVVVVVFLWAFLWGIPGAVIGVPLTLAFLTACEHNPTTRWIAMLLSGGVPKPAVDMKVEDTAN